VKSDGSELLAKNCGKVLLGSEKMKSEKWWK
jgi:hypothetical protein